MLLLGMLRLAELEVNMEIHKGHFMRKRYEGANTVILSHVFITSQLLSTTA